jgi:hypothetical protein
MKTITMYRLTSDDPSLVFIREAFNRVPFFVLNEGQQKEINRVLGGDFYYEDPLCIAQTLIEAGEEADKRTLGHGEPVRASIEQAAQNCRDAAERVREWFADALN